MSTIRLTRDLLAQGYTANDLTRQVRSGQISRLRRGAYDAVSPGQPTAAETHRRLIEATIRLRTPHSVVSHVSAAVMHGLPVFAEQLGRVHLTRLGPGGGKARGCVHLFTAPLDNGEIVDLGGIQTTSLARTIVDLGRSLPFEQAVMAGDAALARGLKPEELARCVEQSARRPGMAQGRRVARFLHPLSESPGESLSRVALQNAGLPPPTLQREIRDESGQLIGRSDFCWEEHRTLGEFDGRVKYGRLLKPGQLPEDVVFSEKVREDALRDQGWQVVRWVWADLKTPDVIADRLCRAFARAAR